MKREGELSGPKGSRAATPAGVRGNRPFHTLAAPLLERLEGIISMGPGRWYARCPAHDDRSPSLSVTDAGDRVLIHCFAGCDPSDVLAAAGTGWRHLYRDPWECARLRPNEGAAGYAKRTLANMDPLEIEREILRIAAADLRAGRTLRLEDEARVEVARLRLLAAEGRPQ